MRYFGLLVVILLAFSVALPQDEQPTDSDETVVVEEISDEDAYKAAIEISDSSARINALKKFLADFPETEFKNRAMESLSSARASLADEKIRGGEAEEGIKLFKLAVSEAPDPCHAVVI